MKASKQRPSRILVALVLGCLTTQILCAENWPHWRGPFYNGSTTEKGLPGDFSKTNNVKWAAPLPGPSAATPIIWGDRIFVSSTDRQTKSLRALCIDCKGGKVLWNHDLGAGFNQDGRSTLASASPVTDGKRVFFYYSTGDLVALDFGGNRVWSRNIQKDYGPFAFLWTYSTSPAVYDGKLFIQVLQRNVAVNGRGRADSPNDSYLLALDPKTGKELWKHIRPSDAQEESLEAFSTPVPFQGNGRAEVLIAGGDCLTGHDPGTGQELWRWGAWNPARLGHWRLVPSPVAGGGVVLACAPKGSPVYAVKAGGAGVLDESVVAWKSEDRAVSSDVCTPLFYKGRFYVLNGDRKKLARVEPATGKVEWLGDVGSAVKIESSPTGADDKIYFVNHRGEVFVVAAAEQFKLMRVIPMGDEGDDLVRSTISVANGSLFIRTGSKLYRVER